MRARCANCAVLVVFSCGWLMTGQRPQNVAPLAEMLRLNGFNTAAFGKSHETADEGLDRGTPVTEKYDERKNQFTGKLGNVMIELNQ